MNLKALVAGSLIGFLAAVVPSCGGSKCDAKSCTGCCSSNGQCIKTNNQDATCGPQGQACENCSAKGQTCTAALSCSGTDGGTTDGGGNQAAVGTLGATCQVDGQCTNVLPKSQLFAPFCKTETVHPFSATGLPYKDGFCTHRCLDDSDCSPDGGRGEGYCVTGFGSLGELESICAPKCAATAPNCRPGYTCYRLTSTAGPASFCWVAGDDGGFPPVLDAGQPGGANTKVGAACDNDSVCSPPENGQCAKATLPDGGPTGLKDGTCVSSCELGGTPHCGTGSICVRWAFLYGNDPYGPVIQRLCEKQCSASAPCRDGYFCNVRSATLAICEPRCDVPPNRCDTGEVCNPNSGQCSPRCDAAGGTCDANSLCNTTSGLCELRCNVSDAGCTGGKTCDPGTGLCK